MSFVAGFFYCRKNPMALTHKNAKNGRDSDTRKKQRAEPDEDMCTCKSTICRIERIEENIDELKTEFGNNITMMYDDLREKLHSHDEQFENLHNDLVELQKKLVELLEICTPCGKDY